MAARDEILQALSDGPKTYGELRAVIARDFMGHLQKLVREGVVKQSDDLPSQATYELVE